MGDISVVQNHEVGSPTEEGRCTTATPNTTAMATRSAKTGAAATTSAKDGQRRWTGEQRVARSVAVSQRHLPPLLCNTQNAEIILRLPKITE